MDSLTYIHTDALVCACALLAIVANLPFILPKLIG